MRYGISISPAGPGGVHGGRERAADWDREREHIRSLADAGATWWSEWIQPADRQRTIDAVRRGPLRID
jgi:hypothetical protein